MEVRALAGVIIDYRVATEPWGKRMMTITSNRPSVQSGEPKPIIPPLAAFYVHSRDLAWLVIRLTAGGMLLVHGINTLTGADSIAPLGGAAFHDNRVWIRHNSQPSLRSSE